MDSNCRPVRHSRIAECARSRANPYGRESIGAADGSMSGECSIRFRVVIAATPTAASHRSELSGGAGCVDLHTYECNIWPDRDTRMRPREYPTLSKRTVALPRGPWTPRPSGFGIDEGIRSDDAESLVRRP
ncbi:hypothetical protein NJ7G_1897 [Natrinema sp. J7-2]|nr:hypothetical protein NJ7G_1897 [Natrinema sp. J7-2]